MQIFLLVLVSLAELVLFFMLMRFFSRLKRSEEVLTSLTEGQESLLEKMHANAQLEKELMQSFSRRQAELQLLHTKLEEKADALHKLIEQAEQISRSPQFLRELILAGRKKGRTPVQLAKSTGLSLDEVELILLQAKK